jgi:hypothetical protein
LLGQEAKKQTRGKNPERAKDPGQQNAWREKTKHGCQQINLCRIRNLDVAVGVVLKVKRKGLSKFTGAGVGQQVGVVGWRRLIEIEARWIALKPGRVQRKK